MTSSAAIRIQIESALSSRILSALTPSPKVIRPVAPTGIEKVDEVLAGGFPVGAVTEIVGPECSGRTALTLSFLARVTQATKICAWIDVSHTFHPESAVAAGVDLARMLWVRCGTPDATRIKEPATNAFALSEKYLVPFLVKKGLHGGGFGPHPRSEGKGLSDAGGNFLHPPGIAPQCAEPKLQMRREQEHFETRPGDAKCISQTISRKPWSRIEQALRVTDLLLQAGGFSAIVLDMGSIAPEYASRVPLATWFRYRTAAERTQAIFLLLTQHACAKSSAELALRLQPGVVLQQESTVFAGMEHQVDVSRRRFTQSTSIVVPLKKGPQRSNARWSSRTSWAGRE